MRHILILVHSSGSRSEDEFEDGREELIYPFKIITALSDGKIIARLNQLCHEEIEPETDDFMIYKAAEEGLFQFYKGSAKINSTIDFQFCHPTGHALTLKTKIEES